jgi:uncharacterized protein involved in response to NO
MSDSQPVLKIGAIGGLSRRWQVVSATPHRPLFFLGAVQLVLVMALWFGELTARALGAPLPFVVVSTWAHVLLMLYGLYTFFIFGFLFTVFPRWMGAAAVARNRYMPVAITAALGMAITYVGFFAGRSVLGVGLALYLGAWIGAVLILLGVYRRARKRRSHEALLLLELILGAIGLGVFLYAMVADNTLAFAIARDIGLWGFLVPVLLTVSHRMIPFFTQSALRIAPLPQVDWSLGVFVAGSLLHGIFAMTSRPLARLVVDLALAVVALRHTVMWGLTRSFTARLLAMLHVAFLWFGIAMLLYACAAALALVEIDVLGRAPLHAVGIGFVTSTLVAMATRVTLGHSGRALSVNAPTWYLFLGISAIALLRIAAELVPVAAYQWLNLLAAAGWLTCLIPWAARYVPMYLRPRVDDRPG